MKFHNIQANCNYVKFNNGDAVGFSYETPVVAKIDGIGYTTEKNWSKTTSRHVTKLLGELSIQSAVVCDQDFLDTLNLSDLH